ncbi:MAG: hypothetical protein AAF682_19485 [Planctomycetota bacterium]
MSKPKTRGVSRGEPWDLVRFDKNGAYLGAGLGLKWPANNPHGRPNRVGDFRFLARLDRETNGKLAGVLLRMGGAGLDATLCPECQDLAPFGHQEGCPIGDVEDALYPAEIDGCSEKAREAVGIAFWCFVGVLCLLGLGVIAHLAPWILEGAA